VSIEVKWGSRFVAAATLSILAGAALFSQQGTSIEDGKRRIKFKSNPQYSDLARQMRLSGKVKIELVIAADGHVKSSRAVGGHPVLVQACLDAVKDWRFEPGPEETTQVIEFDFKQ
jgi:TonB family protein